MSDYNIPPISMSDRDREFIEMGTMVHREFRSQSDAIDRLLRDVDRLQHADAYHPIDDTLSPVDRARLDVERGELPVSWDDDVSLARELAAAKRRMIGGAS